MILGLGVDLVETRRLEEALRRHGSRFEDRVFTPGERRECAGRADQAQRLSARFAAKEACLKALGTGWSGGVGFRDVEVVRSRDGRPEIQLSGAAAARAARLGVRAVHLSLTHQPGAAAAVVILEG